MGGTRGGTGPAGKKNYYMYVYICMYCEFSFLLLLLLWHVINNLVLPNNTKCALPLVGRGRGGAAGQSGSGEELELRHAMRQKLHCECGSGSGSECGRGSGRSVGRSAEWEIGSRHSQTRTHTH